MGDGSNPDNEAMHQFILNTLTSYKGYLGKLFNNIDQAMANDWFDNIFLNKNWNITAEGTEVDGTILGRVYKDGQLVGVRYQLDYYGSKDSLTDLEHHQPLGYTNSAARPEADWDPSNPKARVDVPNMAPNNSWEKSDWEAYDSEGTDYLKNSGQVKYIYIVEFDDEARMLGTFAGLNDWTTHAFKIMDFAWYYNNNNNKLYY
ncbi:hypothetical protein [Spiroplasma mirum]|uniref:hypothetical protein n=1 Tax=Spiroplasma mirum TaxID=2144 RepID=UPI00146FC715|nr:hypothetical protein [Spiroplasma mirum]